MQMPQLSRSRWYNLSETSSLKKIIFIFQSILLFFSQLKELVSPTSTSSAVAVASTSSTAAAATGASTSSVPPPLGSSRIFLGQHLRRYPFPPRFYTNGSLASAAQQDKKEKVSLLFIDITCSPGSVVAFS